MVLHTIVRCALSNSIYHPGSEGALKNADPLDWRAW